MKNVSVLMSVFNEKPEWLAASVASILNQTYPDFEFIIIVDNPDADAALKKYFAEVQSRDDRVHVHYNRRNLGLARSLNVALELSSGPVIARMDADDISLPDRFQKELDALEQMQADVVSCQRILINETGEEIGRSALAVRPAEKTLPVSNCICHPGAMIRRSALESVGGYRDFRKSQDYDLWLRMQSAGFTFHIINEYLLQYRVRESSLSLENPLQRYYITKYQKKLYRERLKHGTDSFSKANLHRYLRSKKINGRKNRRYTEAREWTKIALDQYRKQDRFFFIHLLKAFFLYPEVACDALEAFLKYR